MLLVNLSIISPLFNFELIVCVLNKSLLIYQCLFFGGVCSSSDSSSATSSIKNIFFMFISPFINFLICYRLHFHVVQCLLLFHFIHSRLHFHYVQCLLLFHFIHSNYRLNIYYLSMIIETTTGDFKFLSPYNS